MKIATRVIVGYVLLAGLLSLVLLFTVITLRRLQHINAELAPVTLRVSRESLKFEQSLAAIQEFLEKGVTVSPAWLEQTSQWMGDFQALLDSSRGSLRSDKERVEFERLERFWKEYVADYERERPSLASRQKSEVPAVLAEHLDRLHTQVESLYRATQDAVQAEVSEGTKAGRNAEILAWTAASFALAVGFLSAFIIVRSIAQPLKSLTEGTRAIAAGRFVHKLDTSRKDEFAELARDFNIMAGRLRELDQLKKDFVSHVSHELKSPLASISETLELLEEGVPGPLTDRQRRLVAASGQSCRRLSAMIENLLDLSRIEAGVLEYEMKPASPHEILKAVLPEIGPQARERGVRISCHGAEESPVTVCDAARIHQVLLNLLGNAVKFSPRGSEVEVDIAVAGPDEAPSSFGSSRDPGGLLRISVADRGAGVPDSQKKRIFDKFHQIREGTTATGRGSGLGLAISRAIIEGHGGFIWVEDRPGGGSVFSVLLPRSASEGAGVSPPI